MSASPVVRADRLFAATLSKPPGDISYEGVYVETNVEQLRRAVKGAIPNWELIRGPEPFTWAPHMHFRARLANGERRLDIVIRQAWRPESYEAETFLYRSVLPHISVRTARLVATFELSSENSKWTVLEDLGGRIAQRDNVGDRNAFLRALGQLHGQSRDLLEGGLFHGAPLVRFDGECLPYGAQRVPVENWCALLSSLLKKSRG